MSDRISGKERGSNWRCEGPNGKICRNLVGGRIARNERREEPSKGAPVFTDEGVSPLVYWKPVYAMSHDDYRRGEWLAT